VALAGFAVWGRRSSSSDSGASGSKLEVAGSSGAAVGKAAPRYSVTTLAGSTFTVPAGKPAAVWFTADGCRSCIPKAKALDKIKGDAGDRIAILGVDINPTDTESDFRGWIKEVGDPRFDFAMDKNGALVLAWGVRETSTVVIVDAAGKVVYHSTGVADEATFRAAFATAGLG
ncbi:MAG: TlpA family protein disulfide reductase, partial [Acidimicrobiales bacterium]